MTAGRYMLREYGSWGVMLLAFLSGLLAARAVSLSALAVLAGLSLAINSKQAFVECLRKKDSAARLALAIFSFQILAASVLLSLGLGRLLFSMLPYAVVPLTYIVFLRFQGEHALVTEAAGFALLSLSALVSNAAVTGTPDPRLYAAVAVFFTGGVFKVRIQFRKRVQDRIAMAVYVMAAAVVYRIVSVPLVCLLPFIDNLVFAAQPYRVQVKATGWIEVVKGMIFMMLVGLLYR